VHGIHPVWVAGMCLAIAACGSNNAALQGSPFAENQSSSQSRTEIRSSIESAPADRVGPVGRVTLAISISDLSTGSVSKVVLDKPVADTAIAIHNGSDVSVQLQTDSNVTGVTVTGDALTPTALRRVSIGQWQGILQYWDSSNTPNSKSKISVQLISAKGSIGKSILVTTVHDS
jgi:hypothetical protein